MFIPPSFQAFNSNPVGERRFLYDGDLPRIEPAGKEAVAAKARVSAEIHADDLHELDESAIKMTRDRVDATGKYIKQMQEDFAAGRISLQQFQKQVQSMETSIKRQALEANPDFIKRQQELEQLIADTTVDERQMKLTIKAIRSLSPEARDTIAKFATILAPLLPGFFQGIAPRSTTTGPNYTETSRPKVTEDSMQRARKSRVERSDFAPGFSIPTPPTFERSPVENAAKAIKLEREGIENEIKTIPAPSAERMKILNDRIAQLDKFSKEIQEMTRNIRLTPKELEEKRRKEELIKNAGTSKQAEDAVKLKFVREGDEKGAKEAGAKKGATEEEIKAEAFKKKIEASSKGGANNAEFEAKAKGGPN